MFYSPFWVFFTVNVLLAGATCIVRKLRFSHVQVMIMVAAVAMSCDMLFCKQFHLYHYVTNQYAGWYSFWANLIICPAIGLLFIQFIPYKTKRIVLYIITWSIALTLLELFILQPFGIVHYPRWNIFPW